MLKCYTRVWAHQLLFLRHLLRFGAEPRQDDQQDESFVSGRGYSVQPSVSS